MLTVPHTTHSAMGKLLLFSHSNLYKANDKHYFCFNDSQIMSYLNEMHFASAGFFEFMSILNAGTIFENHETFFLSTNFLN